MDKLASEVQEILNEVRKILKDSRINAQVDNEALRRLVATLTPIDDYEGYKGQGFEGITVVELPALEAALADAVRALRRVLELMEVSPEFPEVLLPYPLLWEMAEPNRPGHEERLARVSDRTYEVFDGDLSAMRCLFEEMLAAAGRLRKPGRPPSRPDLKDAVLALGQYWTETLGQDFKVGNFPKTDSGELVPLSATAQFIEAILKRTHPGTTGTKLRTAMRYAKPRLRKSAPPSDEIS